MRHRAFIVLAFTAIFSLFGTATCKAATLTDPGTLGGLNSAAYGVSADGSIIVGYSQFGGDANSRAFKYTSTVMTVYLGTLGGSNSTAFSISADGSVIVGFSRIAGDTAYHAFKYTGTTMTDLGTLGGTNSYARAASADGAVIVGDSKITGDVDTHAFKYTGTTMTDLGTLGGARSWALGVSADGSVIVGYSWLLGDAVNRAFKYIGTTMTDLGTLGGTHSWANGVSADGAVIVGGSSTPGDMTNHAFKYTGATMTDLGTLGGTGSWANAVSADGSVIVGYSNITGDSEQHAFKYIGTTMTDLGTLGGTQSSARAVSADGSVIVGESKLAGDSITHAFIYRSAVVDADNTVAAIAANMRQLESVLNMKAALVANALNSDCPAYSDKGICLALSGWRYSGRETKLAAQTASTLNASYRFNDKFRAGITLDLAMSQAIPNNFTSKKTPLFGAFAAFGDNAAGLGPQVKLSVAYNSADTAITRTVLPFTEAGKGDSAVKSLGVKTELGYGLAAFHGWKLQPYAALRYSNVSRGGYTEASGATFPVAYDRAVLKQFTTLFGLKAQRSLSSSLGLLVSAGAEQDLGASMSDYSGTMNVLGSFKVTASDVARTRPFASTGLSYEFSKDQRIGANFSAIRQPFGQRYAVIGSGQYTVSF
jgi:probable HAF family extracellular repeat protein